MVKKLLILSLNKNGKKVIDTFFEQEFQKIKQMLNILLKLVNIFLNHIIYMDT